MVTRFSIFFVPFLEQDGTLNKMDAKNLFCQHDPMSHAKRSRIDSLILAIFLLFKNLENSNLHSETNWVQRLWLILDQFGFKKNSVLKIFPFDHQVQTF